MISKLRPSDPYHQTQNVNLRAAKALIIIVPLLGITYLVTIVGPSEPDTTLETIFILTRNVLLSFQGFFITLPYCFLNGEVCTMMKNHWERWRNTQDIGQGPNSARNSIAMQGFNSVCDNLTRKRSRSYSYHVVRGSLVDRRGTQESEMSNATTITKITKNHSLAPQDQGHMDGPLVPHPDILQHTMVIHGDNSRIVRPSENTRTVIHAENDRRVILGENDRTMMLGENSRKIRIGGDNGSEVILGENDRTMILGENDRKVMLGENNRTMMVHENGKEVICGENGGEIILGENDRMVILGENDKKKQK